MSRLRGGSAGAARGASSFLTETVSRVRNAGATGQLTVRADSAFYSKKVLATAAKFDVRFSITARQDKRVRAAIDAIDESAWQPIPYWLSTPEASGADIAEIPFTVFAGDKHHARQVRLVVRRVRPTPGSQLALFTAWDYHAFVTDRDLPLAEVEADHRRHAIVEQTIAELKSAGLAHLPSGASWPTPPGSPWLSWRTTWAAPSDSSPARTSSGRPQRRCAARCSPCPAGSCTPAGDGTYAYQPAGPGPTRSAARLTGSTPSRCAADQPPRHDDQDLGEAGRPATSARPDPDEAQINYGHGGETPTTRSTVDPD